MAAVLESGEMLAGYRIEGVLGRGGMGVVYEARQLSLDRPIALKVLSSRFSEDDDFRLRFRREGLIQARIDHPHIVPIYEAGEADGFLYLAMRLVRGGTLKDWIPDGGLDAARALRLLEPVGGALDAAHDAGLVHRDIKPHNILVGPRDHVFLADFGLTRSVDGESRLTETGAWIGTPDYMAPEQARGETPTGASDIYAFAAVLFECLAGEVPYRRRSGAAVLWAHMSEPPPILSDRRSDVPPELDAVLARGLAKAPEDRFTTASDLIDAARRATKRPTNVAPPVAQPPEQRSGQTEAAPREPVQAAPPTRTDRPPLPASELADTPAMPTSAEAVTPSGAPAERRGTRPHHRTAGALALGVVVALAIGGSYVAGHAGTKVVPGAAQTVTAGAATLELPPAWRRTATPAALTGLGWPRPATFAAADGSGVTQALTTTQDRTLLTPTALERLSWTAPPSAVRLGNAQALRYEDVSVRDLDGRLSVYAVPTSAGVVVLACPRPKPTAATLATCDRVASSLRLVRARSLPLPPDPAYAKAVDTILRRLDRQRAASLASLAAAPTAVAQAAPARRLAKTYGDARAGMTRVVAAPSESAAHARLVAGLDAGSVAFTHLATAARGKDRARYRAARAEVALAQRRIYAALSALTVSGYYLG